jgi:hypothetical protein
MNKALLETASLASAMALFSALPATAMAHAGLDQSSAMMQRLHALAHILGNHPFILIALAVALTGAYGLYRRANGSHRQSD